MSDRPVIFISHSSKDKELALVLQEQIVNVLGINKGNVFLSNDPDAIPAGSDWFEEIKKNLDKADGLIVLVTSASMSSGWVSFEIGYFWHKYNGQFIYSLIEGDAKSDGPIERLQWKRVDDSREVVAFFNRLVEQFGGDLAQLDSKRITEFVKPTSSSSRARVEGLYKERPKKLGPRS